MKKRRGQNLLQSLKYCKMNYFPNVKNGRMMRRNVIKKDIGNRRKQNALRQAKYLELEYLESVTNFKIAVECKKSS